MAIGEIANYEQVLLLSQIANYEQILLLSQNFQKLSVADASSFWKGLSFVYT